MVFLLEVLSGGGDQVDTDTQEVQALCGGGGLSGGGGGLGRGSAAPSE